MKKPLWSLLRHTFSQKVSQPVKQEKGLNFGRLVGLYGSPLSGIQDIIALIREAVYKTKFRLSGTLETRTHELNALSPSTHP